MVHQYAIIPLRMFCNVQTNVGMVPSFFGQHLGICNEDFTFFFLHINSVWVSDDVFVFIAIQVCKPCKNLHTQLKFASMSIWFIMVLIQIWIWVCKDSLTLRYQSKYQYLIGITMLILTWRFFDSITCVNQCYHAFTHIPNEHWSNGVFVVCLQNLNLHQTIRGLRNPNGK